MQTFAIPEANIEGLEKKLKRVQNKCAKYGSTFHYARTGEHVEEVEQTWEDWEGNYHTTTIPVKFVDVEVEGYAVVNGWEYVATLEHHETGNIIASAGKREVPARYYKCGPYCEHCRTTRNRVDSFIIYNEETDEFRQVGRNCLKDFTGGMNAEAIAAFESFIKEARESYGHISWGGGLPLVRTRDYAAYVAETIRIFGYVKRDNYAGTKSTADIAEDFLLLHEDAIRNRYVREAVQEQFDEALRKGWDKDLTESYKLADKVIEFIVNNENDNNYWHNLKVACMEEYLCGRSYALVASAFPAYNRELEYLAEKRDRELKAKDEAARSSWAGKVGDRITFKIAEAAVVTSWETMYGTTNIIKIKDEAGLTYTWKTSCYLNDTDIGLTLKGTIKALNEFRGVKQTELTRCRIA